MDGEWGRGEEYEWRIGKGRGGTWMEGGGNERNLDGEREMEGK